MVIAEIRSSDHFGSKSLNPWFCKPPDLCTLYFKSFLVVRWCAVGVHLCLRWVKNTCESHFPRPFPPPEAAAGRSVQSLCLLWNSGCWRGSEIYECEMASCVDGAERPFSNTHEHVQQQCCIYELDREDFHPPIVCMTPRCCVPLNHDVYSDVMFIIKCPIYLLAISVSINTNSSYGNEVSFLLPKKV